MNPAQQQYAIAIMAELRGWAREWLEGLRQSRALNRTLGLPDDSLPSGFPFGDFSLTRRFGWVHEYGAEELRHVYPVAFVFLRRTHGPGSSVAWSLNTEGPIQLGVFEIAGRVYDDGRRPFRIDADLVLEGMVASLDAHEPVRLASRDAPLQDTAPPHAVRLARVYELRTPGGVVIRRLGVRWA